VSAGIERGGLIGKDHSSFPPVKTTGNVKGSVLASRLAFVREQRSETAVARVLARLLPPDRTVLGGILLPFAWYPFATNERLDRAIADELGIGDEIFLRLGAKSAEDNLTSASQRHYMDDRNPQGLLKNTSAIYKVYYDTGHRDYEKLGAHAAVLRTHESHSYSPSDCLTVVGWYERAIQMCGGRNVKVIETRCRARGDEVCEYSCAWE
jgi:hypothetical protein